ncbi:MAG: DUF5722 domain-containing protein [Oscillospiraceae bacterium]|nr:DUF5722 domain-containing protein [Oscillospiraceae bacterium]
MKIFKILNGIKAKALKYAALYLAVAAVLPGVIFPGFVYASVFSDNPEDSDSIETFSRVQYSDEASRIISVIPYVTKIENGVSRYVPVESREDITANPHSVSLRLQIYIEPEDMLKYSQIYIFKLRPHEEITDIADAQPATSFDIARNDNNSDGFSYNVSLLSPDLANFKSGEIYNKFVAGVREDGIYVPVTDARYIDNINALSDRRAVPPVSNTKKGLAIQMPGEAGLLGVEHTTVNLYLNDFLDAEQNSNTEIFTYANRDYYFNRERISEYDRIIKYFTNEGINVTAVLLIDAKRFTPAEVSENPESSEDPENPESSGDSDLNSDLIIDPLQHLIHPNALAPNQGGAAIYYGINSTDDSGVRYFEAVMSFIAERYVKEDAGFGRIYNIILGSNIGVTTLYNNCGRIDMVSYVRDYIRALRICDAAMRSSFGGARVYAPFDNWFAAKPQTDGDFINKDIIDIMCDYSVREGNFIWNIAFHAYNADRSNPEVWKENMPENNYSTPVITMKNINILCDYLNLEKRDYLPGGETRKVMLAGQGFSSGDNSKENQELQAAAFIYAYIKARYLPDITAFIYDGHVDSRNEITGGSFGLWTNAADTISEPGEKKIIRDVFKYMDTNRESEKINFAGAILGISDFSEISPLYPADFTPSVILKEVTGEVLKSRPNRTYIGRFNGASLSGFTGTSNIRSPVMVSYDNPESKDFNGGRMLSAGFSEPVKGDFGGIFKIFTPDETPLTLEGQRYVGVNLRIDTKIDFPPDRKIQMFLVMESETGGTESGQAPGVSIFEGLANITLNRDEAVYFDISSWTERTNIKKIKLLVNPYSDGRSDYLRGGAPGEYDFNLYVDSIVSARISRMSAIQVIFLVIFITAAAAASAYGVLYARARIISRRRREMRERRRIQMARQKQRGQTPGGQRLGTPSPHRRQNPNFADRDKNNKNNRNNKK